MAVLVTLGHSCTVDVKTICINLSWPLTPVPPPPHVRSSGLNNVKKKTVILLYNICFATINRLLKLRRVKHEDIIIEGCQ